MTSTQHRCVFVGNIPYDATEEQLVQICEEVGPVVSFRLVLDRDTGKPKGYGFCEFRDEETALSARRNLQGYEINGRQLRVDFAENDKGSVDRNREQGRGGPGLTSTIDAHKHSSGVLPLTARSSGSISFDRPVGIAVAAAAAAVMAGALGGSQMPLMMGRGNSGSNGQPNGGGRDGRAAAGNDPLTNHLAGMSKHQLYEIVTQMKDLIQQNQQQARQILIANPQLTKALFQAQIMLGMVRPPAVQLPHQNVITQPQSHIQAPQQQNDQQSQMQPLHMQAVQPLHVQTVPQMQTMQKAQVHINQVQQSQIQAVQTTQPPNVQMQPHVQGVQLSQAESIPVQPQLQASQPLQNLSFQHSVQPIQQSHAQTVPMQLSLQSVPQPPPHSMTLQSQIAAIQTQSLSSQHNNLPPQPLQPPLPQQPRPPTAPPQMQPQPAQSMSFQLPSIPQLQPGQQASFQQPGGMPQTSSSLHFQQQLQPPMLNQAALQPSSQIPHSGADTGGGPNITQGSLSSSMGMLTDGISMGVGAPQVGKGPSTASSNAPTSSLTWNQPPHSIGAMVGFTGVPPTNAPVGMAGQTGSGHSFSGGTPMSGGLTGTVAPPQQDSNGKGFGSTGENIGGGLGGPPEGLGVSGMILSQGYGQVVQPQLQQQSQQQPQMQLSPELEQQKSLLQQVMNLTPEQINSLPPEQRQQVFQLQQAFRN